MTGILLKHIHGYTASGVDEQGLRLMLADVGGYLANGIIFDRQDINRSISVDFIGIIREFA